MPSGIIDLEEDYATGYGGEKLAGILEDEGVAALFRNIMPAKS